MARQTIKGKKFLWHHITGFTAEDAVFLRENFQFHVLDFEDLGSVNPIPKLDLYKHYLFAVFQAPRWNGGGRIIADDLEIFLGADYLVTVVKEPIESVERFAMRAGCNSKFRSDVMGRDSAFLLYKLLRHVFYHAQSVVTDMVKRVGEVEECVYNVHDRQATRDLALLRRNVLFLRSSIDPQRSMVNLIVGTHRPYLPEDLGVFFDDVRDRLDTMWTITENTKQGVDGLFEVNNTLLTHRTNDLITLFTAVAVSLMPPTFLAGVYGMNLPRLPFADRPEAVLFALLLFALLSFSVAFTLLKRYR